MHLEKVRAIVTGAGSGLGFGFATDLVRAGASVAAGDIDGAGLHRLEEACRGAAGTLVTEQLDVTQEASVRAFVEAMQLRLDGVNVLVNNAGVLLDGLLVQEESGWVRRLPAAQWRKVLDVNLTGGFLMAREVAASMLERGERGGCIVNISSLSRTGNTGQSSYAASKSGVDALTRTWALELAPHGIRVAAIAPGIIETPILDNITPGAQDALRARIPLGRFGVPGEVWLALRFILECDYYNGSILEVDGGANI